MMPERLPISSIPSHVGQTHECDPAKYVLICKPALPKMMGTLHPAGSLYEKPVNTELAKAQHEAFREKMESHGVSVLEVGDILRYDTEENINARIALEDFALKSLEYEFDKSSMGEASSDDLYYIGEEYKRVTIEGLSAEQLVDIILTRPKVTLLKSHRDTGFTACYNFKPLANIVFTRDQQITTRRGIVLGRLASEQRAHEVDVMQFCFKKLNLEIAARIPAPGTLEGGDFFPVGEDLSICGIGLRTNQEAIDYMLSNKLFGTRRVAIIRDEFDCCQDRLHLDTVFNILTPSFCVAWERMLGDSSKVKRIVDEYVLGPNSHEYEKKIEGMEFSAYLQENGFTIIPVRDKDQLQYGCNSLSLGNGRILAVNEKVAREIVRTPNFDGTIDLVDFSAITAMYGAVHCASQVICREP
ncbi:hypothetical protein NDN08_007665 [Rhodosorus marinus]|uniref:Arginine deiminase n=1 Tax=Rhodosorus marinus TaxID=101924 RepID=A0AAV8UZQ9_9RHOD|nr:hypothetical protein NDN08_007665 [Rhodosorus marinus]